ncbi:hypothetical protein B0H10DRAFT_1990143 [Mycena sp. CBHHK59/15]|nr:hypothetical protein B0H10DRAFT_1990143 [Mycena sp. CBHHK59/15]
MPPRTNPVDLKQVGKLFKDTLASMRGDALDADELQPEAIAWLKAARCKIMLQIQDAFYQLDRARDTPLSQPHWVDPAYPLYVYADPVPVVLRQYQNAFRNNVAALMLECAFENCTTAFTSNTLYVSIVFPAAPRIAAAALQTLDVDDEFSRMVEGAKADRKPAIGAFAATDFARLLGAARGEGSGGSKSGAAKKRRAPSEIKDESEDEAEGLRLRSMTRASSTATLRPTVGNVRRSARKRVKGEE